MKKNKTKRLTLSKETVSLLENRDLKNLAGGGSDTCAYEIGDTTPRHCIVVQCA
ncbi:MAG TPA: class I lanthipeptide [Thermoanaerobaculia bacterium]|nr:class I lanthipeptide [Thermoanaerobaculia bacterium]